MTQSVAPALVGVPVLETERLRLRGPKASDFEPFAAFLQSPRAAFVGGTVPRVQAWRAFGHLTGHWVLRGYSMFIIADKATDAALGMSGPWFPEGWPEPEIGWSVWAPEAEGKGVAFEAAAAARAWAYETLGWTTAISLIVDGNTRSEALARRMGCTLEGAFTHEVYGKSRIFRHPPARTA
ncbi:GNAT family N-acetyltransferase [Tabrizicola oligotrophica]|uniref:GNAT family N-acetyltransferase n=1 Tax=Tabrizicola oligotrophica TaxID=2710650 RepID=A0A6M0QSZ1_9RHOB|nr:GNAT family N-acetyltransferase [Tabrizicola oligotrophica]NEY90570.1 GNAT family N-acetyltransferase [Tabrizicola oligotrophica]